MNRRRYLAGLFVAVLAPVVATVVAGPAHALTVSDANLNNCTNVPSNVVVNCGFEAPVIGNVVPGWTHLVSHNSSTSTDAAAYSGARDLVLSSTGADDVWTQTVPVKPHSEYLVGAQFNVVDGTPNDDLTFTATNVDGYSGRGYTVFSSVDEQLSWDRGAKIVTTGSGHTMTLTIAAGNVPSSTFVDNVFVVQQHVGCSVVANNLVKNCGFETSGPASWVHVVDNDSFLGSSANSGSEALLFGSSSSPDDVWTQALSVHPHTAYRLTYWVAYHTDPGSTINNRLTVSVSNVPASPGGKKALKTTNVANRFWAPVTTTFVTGASTTSVLTLSGANSPAHTYVDDFSVTAVAHVKVAVHGHKVTTTLTGLGGQTVLLQRFSHHRWVAVRSFVAPTTGSSKSWTVSASSGKYRAVAQAAPGYASASSATVTVH